LGIESLSQKALKGDSHRSDFAGFDSAEHVTVGTEGHDANAYNDARGTDVSQLPDSVEGQIARHSRPESRESIGRPSRVPRRTVARFAAPVGDAMDAGPHDA